MKRGAKPKLDWKKKLLIRIYNRKYSYRVIAQKIGVSNSTVTHYLNGNYPYRKDR
jgi:transposase